MLRVILELNTSKNVKCAECCTHVQSQHTKGKGRTILQFWDQPEPQGKENKEKVKKRVLNVKLAIKEEKKLKNVEVCI